MTSPTSIPAGCEGFIPHLVCDPCVDAIEFYKQAFGATETGRVPAPDGQKLLHAAMTIDGLMFFMADDFPEFCGGMSQSAKTLGGTPVTIHRYVADCDAAIKRAADAGATVKMPAEDMFWGDRYGVIIDPFGHNWSFATRINEPTPEEMQAAMQKMFSGEHEQKQ